MATIITIYSGPDGGDEYLHSTYWGSQHWTPGENYIITKIIPLIFKTGTPFASSKFRIKLTDGVGRPSGGELAVATYNPQLVTADSNGEWYEIPLATPFQVTSGIIHTIEAIGAGPNAANRITWIRLNPGQHWRTENSGGSWVSQGQYLQLKIEVEYPAAPSGGQINPLLQEAFI